MIIILTVTLLFNVGKRHDKEFEEWDNYIIIGKKNTFVIYGEKLAIKIPFEINVNKNETLGDVVNTKNYEEVVRRLNEIIPEKVENFKVVKRKEVEVKTKHMKNIPEISMGDKRYVLTSSLNSMFLELYYEVTGGGEVQNAIVDILNANGRRGYAREAGEKLSKAFSVKYNSANNESLEQYSYVMNKDLSKAKLQEMVMELDEKYFRIKDEGSLPTLANAVFVLGKEQDDLLEIQVSGDSKVGEETIGKLKKIGYKNLTLKEDSSKAEESFIEYNSEDYYTGYKLSQKLGIKHMVENKDLKDRINIFIK
jgi:hypothetical protein